MCCTVTLKGINLYEKSLESFGLQRAEGDLGDFPWGSWSVGQFLRGLLTDWTLSGLCSRGTEQAPLQVACRCLRAC